MYVVMPPLPPRHLLNKQSADRNATKSPLLKLPAEIRLLIFELVLCSAPIRFRPQLASKPSTVTYPLPQVQVRATRKRDSMAPVPRLDLICRKLYDEACSLMYSKPTFLFSDRFMLSCWLRGVKPLHRREVRRLMVCNRVMPKDFDLDKLESNKEAVWTWPEQNSASYEKIVGLRPRASLYKGRFVGQAT